MYNKCLILNQKCIGKFKSYDFTVSYIPNEKKNHNHMQWQERCLLGMVKKSQTPKPKRKLKIVRSFQENPRLHWI